MFMHYTQRRLIEGARRGRFMSNAELAYHHISADARSAIGEQCLIGWLICIPRLWVAQMAAFYKYCSMDTACAVIDQLSVLQVHSNLP